MGRFFNKPEHKRFNINPRFWDPDKEEREEREKRVKAELGIKDEDEQYIPNIKGKFTTQFKEHYNKAKSERRRSTVRLFLILIILLLAAFYLLMKFEHLL